jgi:GNAT superfamily N-acetyltransferase
MRSMPELVRPRPTVQPLLGWWVAEDDGEFLGHVGLRRVGPVALVTRLWVAPEARRNGVGAALLRAAEAQAQSLSLRPELEVSHWRRGAIALYEGAGWMRVASSPDGRHRYVGPA